MVSAMFRFSLDTTRFPSRIVYLPGTIYNRGYNQGLLRHLLHPKSPTNLRSSTESTVPSNMIITRSYPLQEKVPQPVPNLYNLHSTYHSWFEHQHWYPLIVKVGGTLRSITFPLVNLSANPLRGDIVRGTIRDPFVSVPLCPGLVDDEGPVRRSTHRDPRCGWDPPDVPSLHAGGVLLPKCNWLLVWLCPFCDWGQKEIIY